MRATHLVKGRIALAPLLALACVGACLDDPAGVTPPPPPGLVVSDPVMPAGTPTASPGALSALLSNEQSVVYVSLLPGTEPRGVTATVRALKSGTTLTTAVREGGFDPVALAAEVGDTIEVMVRDASGAVVLPARIAVARVRPPIVVRTDPPPRKRDVPLNSVMVVVFSEPIDASTLTGTSVHLLNGTTPVAGRLAFTDSAHVIATFAPDAVLAGGTTYTLVVTKGINDLDGDALEAPVSVEFVTADAQRQIAFTHYGDGFPPDVYVMNTDGSAVTRLTVPAGNDQHWQPAWSPDGTKIAFVTGNTGGARPEGVFVMNADGSGVQLVTECAVLMLGLCGSPTWSPDGTKIAFHAWHVRYEYNPDAEFNVTDIYVVNADGSGLVKLITDEDPGSWGGYPAWSPDGRIAFVSFLGLEARMEIMNGDGSARTTLMQCVDCIIWHPAWSSGGAKLAFAWMREGNEDVYVMNADGSALTRLTTDSAYDTEPTWSPDGRQIAFHKYSVDEFWEIYVMNADGSGTTRLTNGPGVNCQPAWWPVRLPAVTARRTR